MLKTSSGVWLLVRPFHDKVLGACIPATYAHATTMRRVQAQIWKLSPSTSTDAAGQRVCLRGGVALQCLFHIRRLRCSD